MIYVGIINDHVTFNNPLNNSSHACTLLFATPRITVSHISASECDLPGPTTTRRRQIGWVHAKSMAPMAGASVPSGMNGMEGGGRQQNLSS